MVILVVILFSFIAFISGGRLAPGVNGEMLLGSQMVEKAKS